MFKDAFYAALRNDFSDHTTDSFLYRYIKKEKEENMLQGRVKYEGKRKDYYIVVRQRYEDYLAERISQCEYLFVILEVLVGYGKLRLKNQTKELILNGGKRLGGEDIYEKTRKDREKYRIFADMLNSNSISEKANELFKPSDIVMITEEILDHILIIDVKAFLYDIGFSENTRYGGRRDSRKKDRIMDMLSQYCEEKNILFNSQTQIETKLDDHEYIKECEKLYRQLNQERNEKAFVPLEIDPKTGAGIYIVGRGYYDVNRRREIRQSCHYSVMYIEDIPESDVDDTIYITMHEQSTEETLEDAVTILRNLTEDEAALDIYREQNGTKPAGYRGSLNIYFESNGQENEIEIQKQKNESILSEEMKQDERNRRIQLEKGRRR